MNDTTKQLEQVARAMCAARWGNKPEDYTKLGRQELLNEAKAARNATIQGLINMDLTDEIIEKLIEPTTLYDTKYNRESARLGFKEMLKQIIEE